MRIFLADGQESLGGKVMKVSIAILLVCSAITGCSTDRYVDVPGHPFKTNPCCRRTRPIGEFDPRCDALHGGRIAGADRLVIGPVGKRLALHCLFRSCDMGRDVSTAGV